MTKLDTLYRLQQRDIPHAAAVLADAFQHDPAWIAILGDLPVAQRAYAFEATLRYCMRYGTVYAPSEAIEGVAAWLPGELSDLTFWRILRSGALVSGMKIGMKTAMHAQRIFQPIDLDRKAYVSGKPYIYLQVIGVATSFQGQGYGGKLLRALIEKSEQIGASLYLETETETNVKLYEYYGFTVVKKIMLPIVNLPMWEMAREL